MYWAIFFHNLNISKVYILCTNISVSWEMGMRCHCNLWWRHRPLNRNDLQRQRTSDVPRHHVGKSGCRLEN